MYMRPSVFFPPIYRQHADDHDDHGRSSSQAGRPQAGLQAQDDQAQDGQAQAQGQAQGQEVSGLARHRAASRIALRFHEEPLSEI